MQFYWIKIINEKNKKAFANIHANSQVKIFVTSLASNHTSGLVDSPY
jgi:hypothetical protein